MGYGGGCGKTDATVVVGIVWFFDGWKGTSGKVGQRFSGGDGGGGAGVGTSRTGTGRPLNLSGERETVL